MKYNQDGFLQFPRSERCYSFFGLIPKLVLSGFVLSRRGFSSERRVSVNRFRGEPNGCEGLGVVCRLRRLGCPSLDPDLSESLGKL